jgi:uncharacterized protein (DUF983 family)
MCFLDKNSGKFSRSIFRIVFIICRARWLREIGLVGREYKRWFYQKPKCDSNTQGFVSVRIQDFYPVLYILLFGIISSFGILVAEIIYNIMGGMKLCPWIRLSLISQRKHLRSGD